MNALSNESEWTDFLEAFAAAAGAQEWPGTRGASEDLLRQVEQRLKVTLPPSYRAFLRVSNGWRNASREVPILLPAEEIRWFRRAHRDWVDAYVHPMQGSESLLPAEQDYFNYNSADSAAFDVRHLSQTLCISDVGDSAVLLLNPMVVWPEGEWEFWLFANWLPGAARYRSFADWMRQELAARQGEPFAHASVPGELPTVYRDAPTKAQRRIRPREKVFTLDQALKGLTSGTRSRRIQATRQLCRIGSEQAINRLLDLLMKDHDFHVRCEAAEGLGRMRVAAAVQPLMTLAAGQTHTTGSAIAALGNYQDEVSAEFLLQLVNDDNMYGATAAYALARRSDPRAVPTLVGKLVSKNPEDQLTGGTAGRLLAEFEEPGFLALEPLTRHENIEVRQRALVGVMDLAHLAKDKVLKTKACKLLECCLEKETDARLHQWLVGCMAVACNKKSRESENPFEQHNP